MVLDDTVHRRDTNNTATTPTPTPHTGYHVVVVVAAVAPVPILYPYLCSHPYHHHHQHQEQQHLQPTTNQTLAPIKNLGVPTRFYRTKGALCFSNHFFTSAADVPKTSSSSIYIIVSPLTPFVRFFYHAHFILLLFPSIFPVAVPVSCCFCCCLDC